MRPPETHPIAITFADGTVGIMAFVTTEYTSSGAPRWTREPTATNINAEIAKTDFGPGKKPIQCWRDISFDEVPQDRSYRNALRDTGMALEHDMVHAREIHRSHLRRVRAERFPDLDAAYFRADEAGDLTLKAKVASQKQALRDITKHPAIEAAQTIEELKQVWPLDEK